ncbi:MAG: antibiotic biosynthesis monooxygenase [Pseudomonas sp.]|nr:antibiotic biosynthesis monooxygenase [Pseudomonas sp.]
MVGPDTDNIVTLVVKHRIKPGDEARYETWLRRTVAVAARFPGHLGVDVIRGTTAGSNTFTTILKFCSTRELQHWLDSTERHQLIEEASAFLADGDQTEVAEHNEFWFTPNEGASAPAPRWKQATVTFIVILPHTMIVPLLWTPVFTRFPALSGYVPSNIVITLTIVLSVVYIFMPPVTRLFSGWLSPAPKAGKP